MLILFNLACLVRYAGKHGHTSKEVTEICKYGSLHVSTTILNIGYYLVIIQINVLLYVPLC